MTKEEIKILKTTIYDRGRHPLWIKAFDIYNNGHIKQLHMNCKPCYYKVIRYLIQQNETSSNI